MAAKKTMTKAAAKKAPAKKAPAVKAVVKTAPAKKTVAKQAPAKKAAAKQTTQTKYTPEQVYSMIEQAAYYAAVNNGFQKDPTAYWAQAESEINSMIKG